MKTIHKILLLIAVTACLSQNSYSQSWSATWALTADGSSSVSGNVAAGNASGGSGIGTISYSATNGIYANSFDSAALCPRDYYQFTISSTDGNNLIVSSLSFYYSVSGGSMNLAAYYSLDGFANSVQFGSNVVGFTNTSSNVQFTNSPSITVNNGQTLTVRVYGWAASASTRTFRNKTFVISGTTSCNAPTITSTTPASGFGAGTYTLGATASQGTVNWYTSATGGSSIATGISFTTPNITVTTTYYVDATYNSCTSSARTSVIATIFNHYDAGTGISITDNVINSVWTANGNDIYNNRSGDVNIQNNLNVANKITSDSLHVQNIEIGNSIWIGNTPNVNGAGIFSDDSTLMIQCNPVAATFNTILNSGLNTGKVGIGINVPSYKLDVKEDINVSHPLHNQTKHGYRLGGIVVLQNAGNKNIFVGKGAGVNFNDTTNLLGDNTFVGDSAGSALGNQGHANTFVGSKAGLSNTAGTLNSFFGANSGLRNTSGSYNSFFGANTGMKNITGMFNSYFGFLDGNGVATVSGDYNSSVGAQAGINASGTNNSFFGYRSGSGGIQPFGWASNEGNFNSFFGDESGSFNTTGNYNTYIGASAGNLLQNGTNNTFVGYQADVFSAYATSGISNSTALGTGAKVTQSNVMILGNNQMRVGIGLSGETSGPQNNLEIRATNTNGTNKINASGLRFRNLKAASTALDSNATNTVLSVDSVGDVILVKTKASGSGTQFCSAANNNFLMKKTGTNELCNSLVYDNDTSIGIGNFSLANHPLSALHVNTNFIPNGQTGEVFRTDCPTDSNQYWRMYKDGQLKVNLYNPSQLGSGGDFVLETASPASKIYFNTYNTPRMVITDGSLGYVGIGNNAGISFTPKSHLHINDGAADTYVQVTNNSTGIDATDGLRLGVLSTGDAVINQQENKDLIVKTDSTERMRVLNTGEVGIGLSLPISQLHVLGKSGEEFRTDCPTDSNQYWRICRNGQPKVNLYNPHSSVSGDFVIETTTALSQITLSTNKTPRMVITDGTQGYVGIGNNAGTSSFIPKSHLHINDGAFDTYAQITNNSTGNNTTDGLRIGVLSTGDAIINQQENKDLIVKTNTTERMRVLSTGEVGIGTSTPTAKLEIDNGATNINTSGLKFSQLTSNFIPSNTVSKALTVDSVGNVVLAKITGGTGGAPDDDWSGAGTGNMYSTYFTDNVVIGTFTGYDNKFTVNNDDISNQFAKKKGASFFTNADNLGQVEPMGIYSEIVNATGNSYGIFSSATSNKPNANNIGVCGLASGHIVNQGDLVCNIGISAGATGSATQNEGLYVSASGASANYAIYAGTDTGTGNFSGMFVGHFHVDGNITYTGTCSWNSDIALKQNIQPISNAMDIIDQLQPKAFNFRINEFPRLRLPKGNQFGLIAQDVEPILPDLVQNVYLPQLHDSLGNVSGDSITYKALNYTAFIPVLVQGLKETHLQNNTLSNTVDSLKNVIASYESRFSNIETLLAECCHHDNGNHNGNSKSSENTTTDKDFANTTDVNTTFNITVDNSMNKGNTELYQNRPNPFTTTTTFTYHLGQAGMIELELHNGIGEFITKLVDTKQTTGDYSIDWNTSDIAPGIYFYSLKVDGMLWVKKAVKIK